MPGTVLRESRSVEVQASAKEFCSSASGEPYVAATLGRDGEASLKWSNKALQYLSVAAIATARKGNNFRGRREIDIYEQGSSRSVWTA